MAPVDSAEKAKRHTASKIVNQGYYCGVCCNLTLEPCLAHPYNFEPDTKAFRACINTDARELLPSCLKMGVINRPGVRQGVWARKDLKPNTVFGPFKANAFDNWREEDHSKYSWELYNNTSRKIGFIGGFNEEYGNWMRYVNHSNEPNLEAMQWDDEVWYVTNNTIHVGMQLYISYGKDYAKKVEPAESKDETLLSAPANSRTDSDGDSDGALYPCEQCSRCYTLPSLLESHVKRNHTVSAHKCPTCLKCFTTAAGLKLHIGTVHSDVKQHQCPVCSKRFGQKRTLALHIRSIHEGESFVCDQCGKKFNYKGNLRSHLLIHKGIKPYVCTLCGKEFSQACSLSTHRRFHLQIRPHQCPLCDLKFVTLGNMNAHVNHCHLPVHTQ